MDWQWSFAYIVNSYCMDMFVWSTKWRRARCVGLGVGSGAQLLAVSPTHSCATKCHAAAGVVGQVKLLLCSYRICICRKSSGMLARPAAQWVATIVYRYGAWQIGCGATHHWQARELHLLFSPKSPGFLWLYSVLLNNIMHHLRQRSLLCDPCRYCRMLRCCMELL